MIAIAISLLAGVYLIVPSILFDNVVSFFVPAKKFSRSRPNEILYGLAVAIFPILVVQLCSHLSYFVGHYPFALPSRDYALKWTDYHNIVLAMMSDSYFKENTKEIWDSVYRAQHHQTRFLLWMYVVLSFQIAMWILLLKNYGRLYAWLQRKETRQQRVKLGATNSGREQFQLSNNLSRFIVGRVSEWHVLLTTFAFDPTERRVVYVDAVTPDGLYQGRVRNYFTNNDGSLVGILLDGASRFRLTELNEARKQWREKGPQGAKPETKDFWTRITGGTHLYIPASQISNLNVRYESPKGIEEAEILRSLEREKLLKPLIDNLNSQSKKLTVTLTRSPRRQQPRLTKEAFNQRAVRSETANTITYDLRPFGKDQIGAAALYLGELVFRQSIGALKPSKSVALVVDNAFESTTQLSGFIEKLNSAGMRISIEKRP